MDLVQALRSTGAARQFTAEQVGDDVVYRLLDVARFAPNGGNRQAWRVVLLRDPGRRRALRDLYLQGWYEYIAQVAAGLTPWAPVTNREREAEALGSADVHREAAAAGPGGFAEHFDEVPALLAVFADLSRLAAVDRDSNGYKMIGGASVYPFAWSVLLAARSEGLGGVITTMAARSADEVRELLGVPDGFLLACVIALGRPAHQPTKLKRAPVEEFTSIDTLTGPALRNSESQTAE